MQPVTTLDEAIFVFDPVQPLSSEEELADFYVDRGSTARRDMMTLLRVNHLHHKRPVKFLFTGHKGSGKSTEVNKLCQELNDQFFIAKVAFRKRPDVNYVDILVKAAMALFRAASDEQVIKRAPAQIVGELWQDIYQFIEKKIFGDIPIREKLLEGKSLSPALLR